ncbi:MAG TPA: serine hydrolase [Vicinamibacterales bacterium]|nr:serine hydrolase [Vicinamibacterales bacterium]
MMDFSARSRASALFLFWLALATPAFAQGAGASALSEAAIDALMSEAYPADGPGAAVIVARGGQPIYRKAIGMADLELGVKLEPDMVFEIGSVTKQFTAAAVLMLVEEGKLALSDDITRVLPDYPTHGKTITIEHLLTHTSGIKSYTGMASWAANDRRDMTVSDMIDVFKNEPLEFEPGSKWKYNNSGYFLLGAIIEKVSGLKYERFLATRIFEPLGLRRTMYGHPDTIVPRRVRGYSLGPAGLANAKFISMTQPFSAGALLSNVDDLVRWSAALHGGKVVPPESLRRMRSAFALTNGRSSRYGYGLSVGEYEGHDVAEHGGGIPGFSCMLVHLPEDDLTVAVLSNLIAEPPRPPLLARRIAALAIGKPVEQPARITVSPAALEPFVGTYENEQGERRVITRERATLLLKFPEDLPREMHPSSQNAFFSPAGFGRLIFERAADGAVTTVTYSNWTQRETWRRVPKSPTS